MATYHVSNDMAGSQQNLSSSYKTIASVLAGATPRRIQITDVIIGADGTALDNVLTINLARQTANDGTGTSATPNPHDKADAAFSGNSKVNYSAEPTVSELMLTFAINQRSTFEWVAAPGGEIIVPATANNGIATRMKSAAYTSTVLATVKFAEI